MKGHANLLVLAGLAAGPAHGYAVVETVRARSAGAFNLAEGMVYPALYRLERQGLLASTWSNAGARRRCIYTLTRRGQSELAQQRREWGGYVTAMGVALA